MISYKKVGGLRFLKVGRLTVSWSIAAKLQPLPVGEAQYPIWDCWECGMDAGKAARYMRVSKAQMVAWFKVLDREHAEYLASEAALDAMDELRLEALYYDVERDAKHRWDEFGRDQALKALHRQHGGY